MTEQKESNIFNSYKDGLKSFSDFFAAFNKKNNFQNAFSMSEVFRILSKNSVSSLEIYDAWLDGLHNLTRESFMLCRKAFDGQKADSEPILNCTAEMCGNITDRIIEAAKDTPFEAIEPSIKALQKNMDFKNNGHIMKAILQPSIDVSISMMAILKNSYKGMSDMISQQGREA